MAYRHDPFSIFGNPLAAQLVRRAQQTYARYARRFGHDENWSLNLRPQPMPYAFEAFGVQELVEDTDATAAGRRPDRFCGVDPDDGLVVGTIRMGFGHYRIGLAICSAARALGRTPYWLDLLSFPGSTASRVIAHLEDLYARFSRLSQRVPLFDRLIWERVTADFAQKLAYCARDRELSRLYAQVCADLQPEVPFVATHPWAGLAAVHSGIERVVTVVPDNYPLAFHLVEGSVHAVQTPSAYLGYRSLRNMGAGDQADVLPIPENEIAYTGHFVDHELVSNVEHDCDARFQRIVDRRTKRILLSIGGAGAQVQRFAQIITWAAPHVDDRRAAVFVNMGDHAARWLELRGLLDAAGVRYQFHGEWAEAEAFAREAVDGAVTGIHVFLNSDVFPAVYLTNLLMRAADLLVTKPSELSFYPVPKLFIQRVGRHEAWGAIRGAEIGDGTLETSAIGGVYQTLKIIIEDHDLLRMYATNIIKNKQAGIYDGAYNAVNLAKGRSPGV